MESCSSSSLLNSKCAIIHISILLLICIWGVSSLEILAILLFWIFSTYFWSQTCIFLWGIYLGGERLGHRVQPNFMLFSPLLICFPPQGLPTHTISSSWCTFSLTLHLANPHLSLRFGMKCHFLREPYPNLSRTLHTWLGFTLSTTPVWSPLHAASPCRLQAPWKGCVNVLLGPQDLEEWIAHEWVLNNCFLDKWMAHKPSILLTNQGSADEAHVIVQRKLPVPRWLASSSNPTDDEHVCSQDLV